MGSRSFVRGIVAAALAALLLAGCNGTATVTIVSTATPASPCVTLVPVATAFNGVSGVSGLQVPAGTYISAATTTAGASASTR